MVIEGAAGSMVIEGAMGLTVAEVMEVVVLMLDNEGCGLFLHEN